ncbi:EF-hand domain-containing protein [Solimonas marina]|uniref:EF-hand domain-containing protein n=1 Tax=Solimonas marina TaxID=2714601 RepID=A0A969W7N1_9GAMM|nr:EF-hand domain-containing protein [Solimonas marina]NKF21912.1 EF-hand domain-containing protein [Solimonas marina]
MRHPIAKLTPLLLVLLAGCAHDRPKPDQQLREQFKQADQNGDEQLTPEEFKALKLPGVSFQMVDTDGNGLVTLAELENYITWRRVQDEGRRRYEQLQRQEHLPPTP